MAKPKTKERRLQRLYKQLIKYQNQPSTRPIRIGENDNRINPPKTTLTLKGRIEHAIKTFENTKK